MEKTTFNNLKTYVGYIYRREENIKSKLILNKFVKKCDGNLVKFRTHLKYNQS